MKRQRLRPEGVRKAGSGYELVLGTRALVLGAGALALLAVVFMGMALGRRAMDPPVARSVAPAAPAVPPSSLQIPPNLPSGSTINVAPPPPMGKSPVSEKDVPIGDAPRLAIPDLVATNYTVNLGTISPTQKVSKTFTLKNIGKKPLEIASTLSS